MATVVNLSTNNDIDGLLWGWKWETKNLTFSFPTGVHDGSATDTEYAQYQSITGFSAFNAAQKAAARQALSNIESFCGLNFTETTVRGASLRFGEATTINYTNDPAVGLHTGAHTPGDAANTAEANPPENAFGGNAPFSPTFAQGDMWFNKTGYDTPNTDSFQRTAGIMHEIGHSLGLKHGHALQSGHGVNFPRLPANHNSYEYSVMTYSQYVGDSPANGDSAPNHPTTYMQDDILALQYLYGANYGFNAGNSVYTWTPTTGAMRINGAAALSAPPDGNYVFMTIWDGGGTNTYDLSNYTTNMSIDLRPGEWTVLDTSALHRQRADLGDGHIARGNIANAQIDPNNPNETASLIDNANGGSGADIMVGNVIRNILVANGGNDSMDGGAGDDDLRGMAGNDTQVGGAGSDLLDGGAGVDLLQGGLGDDIYVVDSDNDMVREAAGQGFDSVLTSASFTLHPTLAEVELLATTDNDALTALTLTGNGGDNQMVGNAGANTLNGGAGNDVLDGLLGADLLQGGVGNDQYFVDTNSDKVREAASSGFDVVFASATFALHPDLAVVEELRTDNDNGLAAINLTGSNQGNAIIGNAGGNVLSGIAGNDTITGGNGADTLLGGTGIDIFDYNAASESGASALNRDTINDFDVPGSEKIDLSTIDARFSAAGNQAFKFIDTANFSAEGQIRIDTTGAFQIVEINTTGASIAEMTIRIGVAGAAHLTGLDFIL